MSNELDAALNNPITTASGKLVRMEQGVAGNGASMWIITVTNADGRDCPHDHRFTSSDEALCWWTQYQNGNFT